MAVRLRRLALPAAPAVAILLVLGLAACGGASQASASQWMVGFVHTWYASPNASVCDRLTDNFLKFGWGKVGDAGRAVCRADVAKAAPVGSVVVGSPTIDGAKATVEVDYTKAGELRADEFRFVQIDDRWLADGVSGGATPTAGAGGATTAGATGSLPQTVPAPATTQTSTQPAATRRARQAPAEFLAALAPVASHEHGTAVLRGTSDGKTFAALLMKGAPGGRSQADAILRGSCARPGAVAYKLKALSGGISGTTLRVELGTFGHRALIVVVHVGGATSPLAACGALHTG